MIHDAIVHKITRRNPFLQDWPYYGVVDILNPVATAQYQHNVTIPTKPGMMHDFRDLRFFQADGTEMPFWNESQTAGSTSFNWIKPYSASNRKAYVFYGNRDAITQSNGDKTFEFFDDFLGSALDTSKWTNIKGEGVSISGSVVSCVADSNDTHGINSVANMGETVTLRARVYPYHPKNTSYVEGFRPRYIDDSHQITAYYTHLAGGLAGKYYETNDGTHSDVSDITGLGSAGWYVQESKLGISSVIWSLNDTGSVTQSTYYSTATGKIGIVTYANGSQIDCDWIAVRKYTATEPVCQLNQSGLRNPAYR